MDFQHSEAAALALDAADRLASFREQFFIPQVAGRDCIYFTGNSLGLQPKGARKYLDEELQDWAALGVEGHFHARRPWLTYHEIFPQSLAKIVGALPEEVVAMNGLTVNLHLLMTTFYRPTSQRYKIICEAKAFPSDQYAIESQVRLHGLDPATSIIEIAPREGSAIILEEDIAATIEAHRDSLALVLFGGVNYYSGQVFDMQSITRMAHAAGAIAGFDLAHAAGNVPLQLHDWNVDFACWCSYKYLNSGPGSVAGAFIHQRHITDTELPRMAGWWGYEKETRFRMQQGFRAIPTAEGWQLSNAPVLTMAAHRAALDIFDAAGMPALFAKSTQLTGYLFDLLEAINSEVPNAPIEVITPRKTGTHGCQVSLLMHDKGREVFDALMRQGVIADWREPNVIRLAPVPLYNRFHDVWTFGKIIKDILQK